jgi:molybdopterin molybdotransferase
MKKLSRGEEIIMIEQRTPISVTEAISKIMQKVKQGEVERIPLSEADGRYLAEELVADHPIPFFDRSSFDGFAIRAEDTQGARFDQPIKLKVIESIAAGEVAEKTLKAHETIRIMTGAQMPLGADSVIALELTEELEIEGDKWVRINRSVQKGDNVSLRGEDTIQGTVIAPKGRRISAGEMSMLATFGYHQVVVYKQPIIGIFVTGTELLPVDAPLIPGKIRNSNSYMLESQIKSIGAIPKYYGILADDFDLCFKAVTGALQEVDYLITTGGAAVGDFDYVQGIMKKLQAHILFNKVGMRPGSVTTVAIKDEKWIFGLSGNPSACYVGFELFTRPVLKIALGSSYPQLAQSKAILMHDLPKPNPFTRFVRAQIKVEGHEVQVRTVGVDKSGIASSLVDANALLVIPGGTKGLTKGSEHDILWLERHRDDHFDA